MRDLKYAFSRLSRTKKVVMIMSSLVAISCILPWYNDSSVYGIGDMYLGITGPLFLVGFFIMALSGFVALSIGMPMMGKKFIKLPIKGSLISMIAGVQSLFLLLIANSVFYHSKFGVSITQKSPGFGMTIALLSVVGLILGSYFWFKEEYAYKGFDEALGRKEPLIKIPEEKREHTKVAQKKEEPAPYSGGKHVLRGFGFQETRPGESLQQLAKEQRSETPDAPDTASSEEHGGKKENMMIRMDL